MIVRPEMYYTGIELIDNQHKHYYSLVNNFIDMYLSENFDLDLLKKNFDATLNYVMEHFDAEEYLMTSSNYPCYEEHFIKHNMFRDQIDKFMEILENDDFDRKEFTRTISKWMVEWFKLQVLTDDVKLANYILKNVTKEKKAGT